jgi:hypothetical protein
MRKQLTVIVDRTKLAEFNAICEKAGVTAASEIRGWVAGFNLTHKGQPQTETSNLPRPLQRIADQARIAINIDLHESNAIKATLESHNYTVSQVIRKWIDDKLALENGRA